jgi:hypothetical protein
MSPKNFQETATIILFEDYKKKLNQLKKSYNKLQKEFNDLCDDLDHSPLNEDYIQEVTTHLTIYLSELDVIDKKIKEISSILKNIKIQLSN